MHTRNPNYWRTGQPYFDQVTVIDFPTTGATAQVNALLGGQLDAITDVPFAQVGVVKTNGGLSILITQGGGWLPLCMAIDMAPFTDNRVRQAMRLIVDRPAMLEQVLSGYGRVANDLFSPFDACFTSSLPQREQDIDKAKSLLKAAGMDGATFDLHTTNGAAGMVDSAKVFASQAKAAGVTINVHNDPNYYGKQYLQLPFSVDFWGTRNYLPQVSNSMLPAGPPFSAPYNETHWPPKSGPGRTTSASTSRPAPRRTRQEVRHHPRDAEARIQLRGLHHPVLQQPGRRLQHEGVRVRAEQGRP